MPRCTRPAPGTRPAPATQHVHASKAGLALLGGRMPAHVDAAILVTGGAIGANLFRLEPQGWCAHGRAYLWGIGCMAAFFGTFAHYVSCMHIVARLGASAPHQHRYFPEHRLPPAHRMSHAPQHLWISFLLPPKIIDVQVHSEQHITCDTI